MPFVNVVPQHIMTQTLASGRSFDIVGYTSCSAQSAAVMITSLEASFDCIRLSLALYTFGDFCRPRVRQSGNLAGIYAAGEIMQRH